MRSRQKNKAEKDKKLKEKKEKCKRQKKNVRTTLSLSLSLSPPSLHDPENQLVSVEKFIYMHNQVLENTAGDGQL